MYLLVLTKSAVKDLRVYSIREHEDMEQNEVKDEEKRHTNGGDGELVGQATFSSGSLDISILIVDLTEERKHDGWYTWKRRNER